MVEQAGFERAAQALGLSQSAVSQRIKLLEARLGQPVLLRGTPPKSVGVAQSRAAGASAGAQSAGAGAGIDAGGLPERLRIALNADSLATLVGAGGECVLCRAQRAAGVGG